MYKFCRGCQTSKPHAAFAKGGKSGDRFGLTARCRECSAAAYFKRKGSGRERNKAIITGAHKFCYSCKKFILFEDFHKHPTLKGGLNTYCKKCTNTINKRGPVKDIASGECYCRICKIVKPLNAFKLKKPLTIASCTVCREAKLKRWYERNQVKIKENRKRLQKKSQRDLPDSYIRSILRDEGYPSNLIDETLIDVRRLMIQIRREIAYVNHA